MKVDAPKGYHWMKQKGGNYKLMKHTGKYVPHTGASLKANSIFFEISLFLNLSISNFLFSKLIS